MKKQFVLFVFALLPLLANADAVEIDGIYYDLNTETKEAKVTKNPNKYSGEVTIPDKVTYESVDYNVTSIEGWAFYGCSGLTSLTIANNIISIGDGAFYGCSGLNSITVESGNPKYDSRNNCNAIIETSSNTMIAGCKNTIIPNDVTSIGRNAFGKCFNLTSIDIPNSVTSIGVCAFADCSSLSSIKIPSSVMSIGESAFSGCSGLTSLTISNGVQSIGEDAFRDCSNLTSVTIPNSVTLIDLGAFADCNAMNYVVSEIESPFSIYDNVFRGISSETILVVPAGTKDTYLSTAGWSKFQNVIENGEGGEIGQEFEMDGIFYKICENNTVSVIRKMKVLPSNPYYRYNIYSGDIVIPSQVVFAGIAYNVTSIGSVAFHGSGLTSISIPSSITSIDGSSFQYCHNLTSINVESGNQKYDSRNNCNAIIETSSNTLFVGGINTTIPSTVTSIGVGAFKGRSGLTSVTIPNSVTSIGDGAFDYCIGLTSIIIPNSVTSIGNGAFSGCSGLTSITISNSVASINDNVFSGCNGLTSIIIPNSVTSIGNGAFYQCGGLTSITIPYSVTSIGKYAFYSCSSLTSVTIPNSVISINGNPFPGCSNLTSIKVESSNPKYDSRNDCNAVIETLANTLISGCKNTIIPNGITSIGAAFWGCSTLISITIPNSVTCIANGAFYCLGLKSIILDSEHPFSLNEYSFKDGDLGGFPKDAQLIVPKGTKAKYLAAAGWNQFTNIVEKTGIEGDANNDGALNDTDVNIVESIIMGETPTVFVRSAADMNGDEKIDVVDIVLMHNIINKK